MQSAGGGPIRTALQVANQMMVIELKGTYKHMGEMLPSRGTGEKVEVAECPTCHALVLWEYDSVNQHDEWHIRQAERAK
jgi:cytochrome c5